MGSISGEELARWEKAEGGEGGGGERIFVSVRLRPRNEKEIERNDPSEWECINNTTVIFKNNLPERSMYPTSYTFDRVFGSECNTRHVYEEGAKEVALSVVGGINSSIFAYGQTSSGKTYTMTGITEYCVADIYHYITKHQEREFVIKFSAMEIYNEAVRDLLSAETAPLRLLDDPERGTVVEKLTEEILRNQIHFKELLALCAAQRQIGETSLNEMSSRSHQILRLTIESSARQFLDKDSSSTLAASVNFVDLAGSERASQISAGTRLKEGCHINRSLLTLGTVIRKLSKGRNGHIPYRDSKLTRILHSSLGGNARTAIICTMSPARSHFEQTRNTLLFATCAKQVATNAQVNVVMSDKALVKHLQRELARLENELRYPGSGSCTTHSDVLREKDAVIKKMEREMEELMQQRDLAQSRLENLLRAVGDDDHSSRQWDESSQSTIHRCNSLDDVFFSSGISGITFQSLDSGTRFDRSYERRNTIDIEDQLMLSDKMRKQHAISPSHSISSPTFIGMISQYKREEIAETMFEDSEEHCTEVRCIEIQALSTSKTDEFNLLLSDECDSLLPLTEENKLGDPVASSLGDTCVTPATEQPVKSVASTFNDFVKRFPDELSTWSSVQHLMSSSAMEQPVKNVTNADDSFVGTCPGESSPLPSVLKLMSYREIEQPVKTEMITVADDFSKPGPDEPFPWFTMPKFTSVSAEEQTVNSVTSTVNSRAKPCPNKSSPWSSVQKVMSSRELVLTRSISCKASLMASTNNSWFDEVEQESNTPPYSLKEFLGRSKVIPRRINALSYDAKNEMRSIEGSEFSENLTSIDMVKYQDTVPQEHVKFFSNSFGGSDESEHRQCQEQLNDHQETQQAQSEDNEAEKSVKDVVVDPMLCPLESPPRWPSEFERKQQEIIELWHACNVSLVHRTCFFLLFKGDLADSFYMEVEYRRLSFLRSTFSNENLGKVVAENGHEVTLVSSLKCLHRERDMLCRRLQKKVSHEERESLYTKWRIALNSKQRKLQLSRLLWNKTDMEHVRESASLVAKLIGLLEQGHALKEMFGLCFTPQRISGRPFSWKHFKSSLM